MTQDNPLIDRRRVFAGAGAVGALAVAVAVLPRSLAPTVAEVAPAKAAPDTDGGYRLTAHVQRYYETTRI
jgi:hypothetical protein